MHRRALVAFTLGTILAIAPVAGEARQLGKLGGALKRAQQLKDIEMTEAEEAQLGAQVSLKVRARYGVVQNAAVHKYVALVGAALTQASSRPNLKWQFIVLDTDAVNAFAAPGGFVHITKGALANLKTESELAGVLGHEISHVTQRHIARQIYQSKQVGMASMVAMALALLAARSSGQVAGAAIATTQAGTLSAQLAFSRDFEREADRQGFDILRKAGFDVRGMAAFFSRLQQAVRLYENNATAYLRTHPLTGERLTDMQNREQAVPYRQVVDSADFQLVRAKVRAMQGTPRDAVKDLENLLLEKKFASEGAVRYGLAYARYRARDWSGAEREIDAARQLKISAAMLEHLRADVRLAQGDTAGGLTVYRDAMVRYPLNLGLIYGYGGALIGVRRFEDSLRFAEAQLRNYPEDVRLHKMRAESYAGLGQRAMQHRALAEVFILQGQTAGAIEQLQLAQRAGDANFYEMSSIDARLREMRRRQVEEMKEKRN